MKRTLSTRDVKIGMFIAEVDRPWIETPFRLQGFLLENVDQVRALQECCREVVVDHALSVGEYHHSKVADVSARLLGRGGLPRSHPSDAESRVHASRFLKLARSFKGKIHTRRVPHVPQVRNEDGYSRLAACRT